MEGTGGQSFGAFLVKGLTFDLIGDANDYTGKGLSGGRIAVRPSIEFRGDAERNIIVGNTALYGAILRRGLLPWRGGERFAVRLSGATRRGGRHGRPWLRIHDRRHGGGAGPTGRNFAAGMSGGVAFIFDEDGQFAQRCNTAMVSLLPVQPSDEQRAAACVGIDHAGVTDEEHLKRLIEDHLRWTGSQAAREILDHWAESLRKFVKVFPNEYQRALGEMRAAREASQAIAVAAAGRQRRPLRQDREGRGREAGPGRLNRPCRARPLPTKDWSTPWEKSPASWNTSGWKRATPGQPAPQAPKEFVIALDLTRPSSKRRAAWTAASRFATTAAL